MTDAAAGKLQRPHVWAPLLLGVWAASIALAPGAAAKALLAAPAIVVPAAWWLSLRPARWIPLFLAAALLLPPLPIPIGDSGPHPCLLVAMAGVLFGLAQLAQWRIRMSPVALSMLCLFGIMLASVAPAAWRSGLAPAAGSLARVALFGISLYVYFYASWVKGGRGADDPRRGADDRFLSSADAISTANPLRPLYWAAVLAALFACVDFYYQFPAPAGYGPQFVWLDSGVYRRAQGLFYEASTLGNFCAFFLLMIVVALSRPRHDAPVSRKALLAGGAVFFAALVLSYSRASLVSLLVGCLVLAWLNRRRIRLGKVAVVLAVGAAAGAVLVWKLFPDFAQTYWMRLSASAEYILSSPEGVLSGRVQSWQTLVAWIQANPWQTLLGIGYKTLPYTNYLGQPVVADNMYLSLLVETGIAGLAALLWMNWAILRSAARAAKQLDPRRSLLGTWMLCFWAGEVVQMTSGDLLTYWRVLPVYFWVLALAESDDVGRI